jgi:hypothetical protein
VTVVREGDSWRAELLVAVGDADSGALTDGRAFLVELLGEGLDAQSVLRAWQHAYLNEAARWSDLSELAAFRALIKGRRKFQGFGTAFATQKVEAQEEEMEEAQDRPLHRIAGGSGKAEVKPPCCPRCGERLRRLGLFDRTRMEVFIGKDGVAEWRWRARPER